MEKFQGAGSVCNLQAPRENPEERLQKDRRGSTTCRGPCEPSSNRDGKEPVAEVTVPARSLGSEVTILERWAPVAFRRERAAFELFRELHRGRGVAILTGVNVAKVLGT
jgi:hypothetical protein